MSSDNPYTSPRHGGKVQVHLTPAASHRGLTWLLFSVQGRIPRRTYWAISIAASIVVLTIALLLDTASVLSTDPFVDLIVTAIRFLFYPLSLWISVWIQVKRWHDLDRTGWWCLVSFVPAVGPVVVLVMVGCLRGTIGPNRFGEDPTGDRLSGENVSQVERGQLNNAAVVELDGTSALDDHLAYLADNARIEELRLGGTKISDAGLAHIQNLTTLRLLDLSLTHITDAGLKSLLGLSHLTTLWLGGTRISDAGLLELATLSALREIHLANTDVTADGVDRFRKLRPDCVLYS